MPNKGLTHSTSVRPDLSIPKPGSGAVMPHQGSLWSQIHLLKVGLFGLSILLFVLAIYLMKEGAHDLTPLIRERLAINNAANSMGFGWLFAYLIISGSPVAASALTFLDVGALDRLGALTMMTGSRLGASFIVLFIGFIYVLRGRDRATGLSMGLLALTVTGSTYLAGLVIGLGLLQLRVFDQIQFQSPTGLTLLVQNGLDPLIRLFLKVWPAWVLFIVGLGLIMLSFNLFDRCLPQVALKESQIGHVSRLVYRPWVMFILGAVITLLSMSVSISLSILVPLSHRGFIR